MNEKFAEMTLYQLEQCLQYVEDEIEDAEDPDKIAKLQEQKHEYDVEIYQRRLEEELIGERHDIRKL